MVMLRSDASGVRERDFGPQFGRGLANELLRLLEGLEQHPSSTHVGSQVLVLLCRRPPNGKVY